MDLDKFEQAKTTVRDAEIPCPALKQFFAKNQKPVWKVRALTAAELGRCNEINDRSQQIRAMTQLLSGDESKSAEVRRTLGLDDDSVPVEVSKRIEMLTIASISPALGRDKRSVAVKVSESWPILFYDLTNKIHELTAMGADLGKPKRSGKTRKSGSR